MFNSMSAIMYLVYDLLWSREHLGVSEGRHWLDALTAAPQKQSLGKSHSASVLPLPHIHVKHMYMRLSSRSRVEHIQHVEDGKAHLNELHQKLWLTTQTSE